MCFSITGKLGHSVIREQCEFSVVGYISNNQKFTLYFPVMTPFISLLKIMLYSLKKKKKGGDVKPRNM